MNENHHLFSRALFRPAFPSFFKTKETAHVPHREFKASFMNKHLPASFVWQWMIPFLGLVFGAAASGAITFSVTPSTVADNNLGPITLQIGGLLTGEKVWVGKFADANNNGTVDTGDSLIQAFPLTDGQMTVVGGGTNTNIPGDLDAAAGSVKALLNLKASGVEQQLVGNYLFMLISPTGRFEPVGAPFQVSNATRGQSIAGAVQSGGSPVPNAFILLFGPPIGGDGMNPIGGIIADNAGRFSIQAAPGDYTILAFRSNHVANFSTAPAVHLGAGVSATATVTMAPATRSISGRVSDAARSDSGLPGIMLPLQTDRGDIALGFTDTDGAFTVPVTSGQWEARPDDGNIQLLGFVPLTGSARVDAGAGSVSGLNIAVPKAVSLFYGHVRDALNQPMPGLAIYAEENSGMYECGAVTDDTGRYVMGVTPGAWRLSIDNNNPAYPNYIFSQMQNLSQIDSGQAIQQHFGGIAANYRITGTVKGDGGAPVTGLGVYLNGTINATTYNAYTTTDDAGRFSLATAPGTWRVGLSCEGNEGLGARGYSCAGEQTVVISNAEGQASFVVSSCPNLAVRTSSLPAGQNGSNYYAQLEADGCQTPFHWSLAPGSPNLPAGLNLNDNGTLTGQCQNSGNFNFTVRVTDASMNASDRPLSIQIAGNSLQINTFQLPAATVGSFYSAQLTANGGQQPYAWSLALGSASLPPGLDLQTNGIVSGTPSINGSFYFMVKAVDSLQASATGSVGIQVQARPVVSDPARSGAAQFQFKVTGAAGQTYSVESTPDFKQWTPVLVTNAPANSFLIQLDRSTNRAIFYRVKVGP
jgi:hypothetical protein